MTKFSKQTMIVGAKLRRYFEANDVCQSELAGRLKTSQSWISRVYNGEFTSRSKVARELCEIAKLPFLEDSQQQDKDDRIIAIASKIAGLRDADIDSIKRLSGLLEDR